MSCRKGRDWTTSALKKERRQPVKYVNNLSAVAGFKTHFPATLNLGLELESPKYLDCLEEMKGTKPKKPIRDDDLSMTCNETQK